MKSFLYTAILFFIVGGAFLVFFTLKEKYVNHKVIEEIRFKEIALDSFVYSGVVLIGTFFILRKKNR